MCDQSLTLVLVLFWDSLSVNLELTSSARPAGQWARRTPPSPFPQHCDYRMMLGLAFLRERRLWRWELWASRSWQTVPDWAISPVPVCTFFLMGFGFVIVLAFKKRFGSVFNNIYSWGEGHVRLLPSWSSRWLRVTVCGFCALNSRLLQQEYKLLTQSHLCSLFAFLSQGFSLTLICYPPISGLLCATITGISLHLALFLFINLA